ncbi:MAG TPA: HAMP domain-containing sensor histidine kinase, partial [Streptosporangiaceae bacterium]|nr:HAMP domain-containing sensor histidine kinase [Streptosporangiaceae bacterium]
PATCVVDLTAYNYFQDIRRGAWKPLIDEAYLNAKTAKSPTAFYQMAPGSVVSAVGIDYQGEHGIVVGVVLVMHSTAPLDSEIRTLWTVLAAIGLLAILAASLLAIWLARWISRPLLGLDAVAGRLADGDLTVRATTNTGPPELRRLSRTFNTMAGRLENLVHGSRAVLADVSHQLRTPLAALRLRLDFMAADAAEADPELAAELAGAQDEVTRLNRLVDGLLAVARAENVQPHPEVIDVALVVAERVAAWTPVAEDRGIDLIDNTELSDGDPMGPPPVLGWLGEGHLEQILDNLIANALDALSPGDAVIVTANAAEEGRFHVMVRDNGPGMSAEDKQRAFLRFTSGRPAGSGLGGTGLGMAIVHRLVTSNGGTAELADTPGGGLTVLMDLPAADTDMEAAPADEAEAEAEAEAEPVAGAL